ncbi:MAG: glycosyltransferase [Ferruginibacter sp.]|nr:glycosyltransferase [Ferruginibacter sp.]
MLRLAIITTHPIQYNAPMFKLLAERKRIEVKVFYTWGETAIDKYDPGFNKHIEWDIPLLGGYSYCFVNNISAVPGSNSFKGIDNPTLIKQIETWKADAVLVYGWCFKSHLKAIRYFHKKIAVIFRGDSTTLNEAKGLKKIARTLFLKWVYSYVDYALYVGVHNKSYFKKHGLKENQLFLAAHAVDNGRFAQPDDEYKAAAKKWRYELGIREHELTILFAGKLEAVKNPGFIVNLAKKMMGLPIKFILVGNGHLEKELRTSSLDCPNILFLDFQNQLKMPIVYRLGDLFILSSKSETWGLGVNEAMACGKGVLVSDRCGCAADLVTNDQNGYVFSIERSDDVINKIKEFLTHKEQVKMMGMASSRKIAEFSFLNTAKAIEMVIMNDFNSHHPIK